MSETIQENTPKKRMLSGIKPSGDLTLGSYLGAVKNWAERAEEYDCFYFMADLHAITVRQNPADLRRRTLEQLAQYIACGLDPEKNTLFVQSHVHQHAELEEHAVRPEPRASARRAGLGAGLLLYVRRAEPYDPV